MLKVWEEKKNDVHFYLKPTSLSLHCFFVCAGGGGQREGEIERRDACSCIHIWSHAHMSQWVHRSQETTYETRFSLSFHHLVSRYQTVVVRFGGNPFTY